MIIIIQMITTRVSSHFQVSDSTSFANKCGHVMPPKQPLCVKIVIHFNINNNKALSRQTQALIEQVHIIMVTPEHRRVILHAQWEMWFFWSGCWITKTV